MTTIADVSSAMMADHDRGQLVGMPFFRTWSEEISRFSYRDLLLHQMQIGDRIYVNEFILGTPFLWKDKGAHLWIDIIHGAPRPSPAELISEKVLYNPRADFCDVVFLSKYVGVDALGYLAKSPRTAVSARDALLLYFQAHSSDLPPGEVDDAMLDGELAVAKEIVAELRNDLCQGYGFQPAPYDVLTVSDYVAALAPSR